MMTFCKKLIGTAALAFAFAASAAAEAPAPQSVEAAPPATETSHSEPLPGPALWQVSDEDTTVYLFGTVHVLPAEVEWMDERISTAFDSADELVFEVDITNAASAQQRIGEKALLEGDATLRELMTPQDRAQFEQALADFGLPAAAFDRVEPWMAAMTLSILPLQMRGYNAEKGVEMTLGTQAGAEAKTRRSLETIEEQIDLFDSLPMDSQLRFLDATVEAIPGSAATIARMVDSWLHGDADTLAELLNEEMDDPALHKRLLTDRNANWAEWIAARMEEPGTVFIAVGAGHLAGASSVQDLLVERGFEVARVWE